ncbi:RodZ family helix-turn-helix domain-containing protein [uncultured Holdemanella sp.]|uniref:helix-turn-helix domain-containing protein n=1 Tax=uncultured Holdemanella sp. TaxID=1763549 RepID=UPI0025D08412|nr:helix-turn-helix transcriptional regulator [uncultured Holdemanella sp.]
MAYYHILKERRTNLKLSIQDVSNQTRLAPQYIQAIEEHNLDVFSDDFSFVRYFVHAYCDAIGVNWQAIADEVDMDINEVAHQKDMALTMAQRRMVQQMASVQKKKKSSTKKKKSWFQKHVSHTSSSLSTNQSQLIKVLVLIGIVGLCVLSVINFGLRAISNQKLATQEALRQEQLSKKEQETNKLANQRQKAKEAEALVVEKMDGETNAYQLSNIQSDVKKLDLSITLPTKSKITLTKDGETINDDTKVYTGTFTHSLELSENCTFEISIETYSDNSITIDGKEISFDKTDWQEGEPAVITLQVGKGNQKETEEYSEYDSDYDYGYSDEYYGQEGDYTYDQNEYTEQTNDY